MSKRNLKRLAGNFNSNLIGKLWAKINTSTYGTVALPDDSQALTIKGDTNVALEFEDEKSGARTNTRNSFAPIRMKGKNKLSISTFLDVSEDNGVESSLSQFLELIMGKKTTIASTQGASASIQDPLAVKAGLSVTTAGALIGMAGNYVTIVLSNGGASGTAAVAKSGNVFTLTYYNDSTIASIVSALDAQATLTSAADANGTAASDLFIDLLSARGLSSSATIYLSGGAEKGFTYSNEEAPRKDMTVVYNKEKTGEVITGVILDKMSIEIGDKLPSVKFEGMARKSVKQGVANTTVLASSATKLYVGSEYKQFAADSSVPSYVDVIAVDGITFLSKANKVISVGTDGTGNYVEVLTAVSAPIGSYVAFHEPENHNPSFQPLNGMTGTAKIDEVEFDEVRTVKLEYANNHQVFDNLALEDSIKGFDPSKEISCKISFEVLARKEHLPLINKLREANVQAVPVELQVGNTAGSKFVVFARLAHVKAPNLADKNDEVQTLTLECEVILAPETVELPSVVISMC